MNQRLTRKDMKRDEFVEALERSRSFVEANTRFLVLGAVALILVGLVAAGAWFWLAHERTVAGAALAEAVEAYGAPLGGDAGPAGGISFPDAAARRARAKELFTAIRDSHGLTAAADVAAVYLGQIAAEEGDVERAHELWSDFVADHEDHVLADQVRVNLLHLDLEQGRGQQVVADLEAMLSGPVDERPLPGDVVLYELARGYQELGQAEQAQATVRRLTEEYPTSPLAALAQRELAPAPGTAGPAAFPGIG
jgi:tetratricopeptide (TPR) repeat protein